MLHQTINLAHSFPCFPHPVTKYGCLYAEAWNCMPRLNMQALRKPLETDVEITAPRYMRGDHYANSCFLF